MRTFTAMLIGLLVTTAAIVSLTLPGEGNQLLAIAVVVGSLLVLGIPMIIISLKNANRHRPAAVQESSEMEDISSIDVNKSRQVLTDKVARAVQELKDFEEKLNNDEVDLDNAEEPLAELESFINEVQSETAELDLTKEKLRKISIELNEEGEADEANAFFGRSEQLGRLSQEGKEAITELYKWSAVIRAKIAARCAVISVNRGEDIFAASAFRREEPELSFPKAAHTAPAANPDAEVKIEKEEEAPAEEPFQGSGIKADQEMEKLMGLFTQFKEAHRPLKSQNEELQQARREEEETLIQLRDVLAVKYGRLTDIMRSVEKELSALRIRQAGLEYNNRQFSDQILSLRGRLPNLSQEDTSEKKRLSLKKEIEGLEKAIRKVQLKCRMEEKLNGSLMKQSQVNPINIYKQDEVLLTNRLNEMLSHSQKLEEYEIQKESIDDLIRERTEKLQENSEKLRAVNTQISLQTERYQHYERQQRCLQEINSEVQTANDLFDCHVLMTGASASSGVNADEIDLEKVKEMFQVASRQRERSFTLLKQFEAAKAKARPVLGDFRSLYVLLRDETRERLKKKQGILNDLKLRADELSHTNKGLVEEIERLHSQLPGPESGNANLAMLGDLKQKIAGVERAIKKVKYKNEFTAGLNVKEDEVLTFDLKDADAQHELRLQAKLHELLNEKRGLEEYLIRKETLDEMIKDRQQSLFRNTQQVNNMQNKIVPLERELKFISAREEKITVIEREWDELSQIVPVIIGALDEPVISETPEMPVAEGSENGGQMPMPQRPVIERMVENIHEGRIDEN